MIYWYIFAYCKEYKNLYTVRDFICPAYILLDKSSLAVLIFVYFPIADLVAMVLTIIYDFYDIIEIIYEKMLKEWVTKILDYEIRKRG
jgi:hypothetical protein